jgi:hypothetical protein
MAFCKPPDDLTLQRGSTPPNLSYKIVKLQISKNNVIEILV